MLAFNIDRLKCVTHLIGRVPGQTNPNVLRNLKPLTAAVFLICGALLAVHAHRGFTTAPFSLGELILIPFSLSLYTRGLLFLTTPFWPLALLVCAPLAYAFAFSCLIAALLR